jgi:hypothetical protein
MSVRVRVAVPTMIMRSLVAETSILTRAQLAEGWGAHWTSRLRGSGGHGRL